MIFEYMDHGDLVEVLRSNSGVLALQREDLPILKMVCNVYFASPFVWTEKVGNSFTPPADFELGSD